MPSAVRTIEIDAPPSVVMGVITDFPSYPSFLPEMKEARVVRHAGPEWEVAFSLALIRDLHYTLRLVQSSALAVSWSLVDGAFQANDGRWVLEPRSGGARTFATYTLQGRSGASRARRLTTSSGVADAACVDRPLRRRHSARGC
jgi:ribosome-associated toxin RatA of RatAB toxin-antitoxin module